MCRACTGVALTHRAPVLEDGKAARVQPASRRSLFPHHTVTKGQHAGASAGAAAAATGEASSADRAAVEDATQQQEAGQHDDLLQQQQQDADAAAAAAAAADAAAQEQEQTAEQRQEQAQTNAIIEAAIEQANSQALNQAGKGIDPAQGASAALTAAEAAKAAKEAAAGEAAGGSGDGQKQKEKPIDDEWSRAGPEHEQWWSNKVSADGRALEPPGKRDRDVSASERTAFAAVDDGGLAASEEELASCKIYVLGEELLQATRVAAPGRLLMESPSDQGRAAGVTCW